MTCRKSGIPLFYSPFPQCLAVSNSLFCPLFLVSSLSEVWGLSLLFSQSYQEILLCFHTKIPLPRMSVFLCSAFPFWLLWGQVPLEGLLIRAAPSCLKALTATTATHATSSCRTTRAILSRQQACINQSSSIRPKPKQPPPEYSLKFWRVSWYSALILTHKPSRNSTEPSRHC